MLTWNSRDLPKSASVLSRLRFECVNGVSYCGRRRRTEDEIEPKLQIQG
jgi:hypothetical protein